MYGQAKLRFEPSTRAYAQDLDLGRQVAAWEGQTTQERIELLPRLWYYTLLRCSLTNRADSYPLDAFHLLLLLERESEAQKLAELSRPPYKAAILLYIARYLAQKERYWTPKGIQILMRVREVIRELETTEKDSVSRDLGMAFAAAGLWEQAEETMNSLQDDRERASSSVLHCALCSLERKKLDARNYRDAVQGV